MLSLLNKGRAQRGISEKLYMDEELQELAQTHSEYMVEHNTYSHYTLEGESPIDRA